MSKTFISLTDVPRRLRENFGIHASYRRIYNAVIDGCLPATRNEGGNKWLVDIDDLPDIANAMQKLVG